MGHDDKWQTFSKPILEREAVATCQSDRNKLPNNIKCTQREAVMQSFLCVVQGFGLCMSICT